MCSAAGLHECVRLGHPAYGAAIQDLYTDNSTCLVAAGGISEPVSIRAGLCHGCPLSGILFNKVVDRIVRDVQGEDTSHHILA